MQTLLGIVTETFMIRPHHRVLVLDRDCSKQLNFGEFIDVKLKSGKIIQVQVIDGMLHDPNHDQKPVAALRVDNKGFPADQEAAQEIRGSEIFGAQLNK